jgi:hypothetical protein
LRSTVTASLSAAGTAADRIEAWYVPPLYCSVTKCWPTRYGTSSVPARQVVFHGTHGAPYFL